jgi:UDP-N-acetylmuramoyl-L-alanyl-D-glutamate--2,6-diaminopimelate ligase
MRLSQLARAIGATLSGPDIEVSGVSCDSRTVSPGDLFVAVRGSRTDGMLHIAEALARGAAAVCSSSPEAHVPTLVVADTRAALGPAAAAVFGHPAQELTMIGVSGTLGKTSTVEMIEAALREGGIRTGVIGSLGIHYGGEALHTGLTTPEAPEIHGALRRMVRSDVRVAAMEVTSHSIALGRINGLTFDIGVFTNLVTDEHLEFHGTPEAYLETKLRYFGFLSAEAPLIFNRDEPLLAAEVRAMERPLVGVTLDGAADAAVRIEELQLKPERTSFVLRFGRPLRRLDGEPLSGGDIPLVLPFFGVQHVMNAALAAVASLVAGGSAECVAAALRTLPPIRRRMEVVRHRDPLVIDDTVGNPRSLRAVLASVEQLREEGLHIVFGIRGSRGVTINEHLARELAALCERSNPSLVITSADDAAGPRDRVLPEEREAFLSILDAAGVRYGYEPGVEGAIARALRSAAGRGTVLLLGAGGLDRAASITRDLLAARG